MPQHCPTRVGGMIKPERCGPDRLRFCCILMVIAITFATHAKIVVVESTPRQCSFTWQIDGVDTLSSIDENGARTISLSFAGSTTMLGGDGEPMLPGESFVAGIPESGEIQVSFSAQATRTIHLTAPVKTWNGDDRVNSRSHDEFSGNWISRPRYSRFRTIRAAHLVICPVRYDQASGMVEFITSGVGVIYFPPASPRSQSFDVKGDYERMLRTLLLNYDVASGWRRTSAPAKRKTPSYPLTADRKLFSFKIGDGHGGINEGTINENGILKISGAKIKTLFGNVAINQVKLHAAYKGMLPDTLPADGSFADGVAEMPLLRCDANRNSMVDDDDYFLAYVSGASDWAPDEWENDYRFVVDKYDDTRTYWLSVGPGDGPALVKMPVVALSPDRRTDKFMARVQYRQSLLRKEGDTGSRRWLWKVLSIRQPSFSQRLQLSGVMPGDTGWVRLQGDTSSGHRYCSLSLGSVVVGDSCIFGRSYQVTAWGDSTLHFVFDGGNEGADARFELECFDVIYPRRLAIGDAPAVLSILPAADDTGIVAEFNLSIETRQKIYIFRVSADEREIVLVDTVTRSVDGVYNWIDSVHFTSRYIVTNDSGLKQLPEVAETPRLANGGVEIRDLHSGNNNADFLIISHPDFIAEADSLARHKRSVGFKNPVVVDVNHIYRFFSGGDKDVAAIRNFIGYARRNWKDGDALDYVLFVGVGHYDTKNYTSQHTDFIPVYINGDSCIEDYFTRTVYGSGDPQLALGRLPCRVREEARVMVNKIVEYEDSAIADFGEWRNRMLFVADDDRQGEKPDGINHVHSTDTVATFIETQWPSMDLRKIYLYEYAWDQALQKPGASRALINEFNNGLGYINFFGHGADITWTDEYILTEELVAGMNNAKRYPIVSSFSCSVGKFDTPGNKCLSGVLMATPGAGAIAALSGTRATFAGNNEELCFAFNRFLLDTASARSTGMALVGARSMVSSGKLYCILGDPSVRPVRATRTVSMQIDDADDTVAALQELTISGSVLDNTGKVDVSFGGGDAWVAIGLFNPSDSTTRKDGGDSIGRYMLPGAPMFLGKTALSGGTFRQTVLVPQSLTFDKPGVKLTAYAWKGHSADAATGFRGSIIFHGSQSGGAGSDTSGPRITIRPAYDDERLAGGEASFTDRITTQMPVKCEVELYDESGIDATGIGPDEGVTLELDGAFARRNVNNNFQFREGDFRRGIVSVVYEEDAVKPGTHTLILTARDLVGNLSKARFTLVVTAWDDLRLDHVLNFPNPVRMGSTTRFYCHSNYTSQQYYRYDVKMHLKIYSLGGRLLRMLKNIRNGEVWDVRDQRGELLSPDVYLYQVTAEDYSQRKTVKSKILKLVVLPPR